MAQYLLQLSYSPAAWAAMIAKPQDRIDAVRPVLAKLGGTMDHAWFTFGDHDLTAIMTLPANVDAAAFSVAVAAGGAVTNIKTTPLLSVEEGIQAMRKASSIGYNPPGTKAQSA